jgi:hypothetical protein
MIKHIVMWNVLGIDPAERGRNALRIKAAFEGIQHRIPGLLKLEIGIDQSHVDYACDVVLYSEFETLQALAEYAVHPEHTRVRQELEGLRITRHQVDYIP